MANAFVSSLGSALVTPKRRSPLRHQCVSTRTAPNIASISMSATRSPWPFKRFLKTFFWYTPLGPLVGRPSSPTLAVRQPAAPKAARTGRTVLVTGAAGGVGRRVVRELLRDGVRVRALVRNLDAGVRVLRKAGVSTALLDAATDSSRRDTQLQFIVSDLFNLRDDMFDGVDAVISATGTRIGPVDDTPDRAKYYQGLVFYPPTVLEDTPENVEYVGVKALVEAAAAAFSKGKMTPVWTFDSEEEVNATWGPLDDVVMGGVSQSKIAVENGVLVFTGNLSVQNRGGFASTRSIDFPSPIDLSSYDGVMLRVRGDGKRYKFIVRCDRKWDGIGHCFSFDTVDNEYIDVKIPWKSFNTVFRGRTMPNEAAVNPAEISAIQIMLSKFEYDGALNPKFSDGSFELRSGTIKAYKELPADASVRNVPNRFVHCSTAGATRVLRKSEFNEKELPPAVRLNDTVGRVVEWKLAGEDVVRQTVGKYGYTIIRPCAMTEKEAVGLDGLQLEQGDNITGQASRDDIARLMVEALFDEKLTNKTFEVRQTEGESVGTLKNQTGKLVPDSDATSRNFGPFPYVPS